jgi:uncharacterized protein
MGNMAENSGHGDGETSQANSQSSATGPDVAAAAPARMPDRKLLELLVCPVTKQPLDYDAARQELISRAARLAFPIRDGIPVMLIDEARELDGD